MSEVEDIKLNEEEEGTSLPQEQADHLIVLIEYLCSTYNGLLASIVEISSEGDLVLDAEGFDGVLTSLKTTAENFASIVGVELGDAPKGVSKQEQEIVDGE